MSKIYTVEIENENNNTIDSYSIAIPYGTCSTLANTAAKVINSAQLTSLVLEEGLQLKVRFVNGNTAINPTLTINDESGTQIVAATAITANINSGVSANNWAANCILDLVYNGTAWVISSIGAFNAVSVTRQGNILSWGNGYIASGSLEGVITVITAAELHAKLIAANAGIYYRYTGATTTIEGVTYIQGNIYTYESTQATN